MNQIRTNDNVNLPSAFKSVTSVNVVEKMSKIYE